MSQQPLRRVLIVDDEPAVREMLAIALKMAGFEVSEADNASTALNQVASSLLRLNANRLDDATNVWP